MLSSSSSVLDTLPTRPPTPPNHDVDAALKYLGEGTNLEKELSDQRLHDCSTDTPPRSSPPRSSPPHSQDRTGSHAGKKVGFLLTPTYHQLRHIGSSDSLKQSILRPKPVSHARRPLKSILKLSQIAPPPTPEESEPQLCYFTPDDPNSFAKMLRSVMHQLASESLSSRLDAYLALNGALKAYEGVPDRQAMLHELEPLTQFVRRDISSKAADPPLENNIATQALKLTAVLLFDAELSKNIDDDFRAFLLDRSINVLERSDLPKQIMKGHLFLIAQQRFHHKVMTDGRAERVIKALQTIEERCSGNSLIATRLVIYHRLLEQAPGVMLGRSREWLDHVFHGMLSSFKENKVRAIEVCIQAGLWLGTNASASKALQELFETEVEEGTCYYDYFSVRLVEMIKEDGMGIYVPQIWAAVILFFRSKRRPLQTWSRMKPWMGVIQRCLNSGDLAIKHQGHLAWRKFVFSIMPDASTFTTVLGTLKVPIQNALEKQGQDKTSRLVRELGLDGYCNLLHYALRPSLTHGEIDAAWDSFVDSMLAPTIASSRGRARVCSILNGLLSENKGAWNENAALETSSIKPGDLPRLDPRWVRSRLSKIFRLFEPLVAAALSLPPESYLLVTNVWDGLLRSVKEAGVQEVRASNELKEAVATIMNTLRRLWACCIAPPTGADPHLSTARFARLLDRTCRDIGVGHLTEDILVRNAHDEVQAAPTPSNRPSKHRVATQSPLAFVLTLLCQQPSNLKPSLPRKEIASDVLNLAYSSKASLTLKLNMLARTLQALQSTCQSEQSRSVLADLWTLFAELASGSLAAESTSSEADASQTLKQQLRDGMDILEKGLTHTSGGTVPLLALTNLARNLHKVAQTKAGEGAAALEVTEPLARFFCKPDISINQHTNTVVMITLLKCSSWPQSRIALDHSRKVLYGNFGLVVHKSTNSFDPYTHLYRSINDVGQDLYDRLSSDQYSLACDFVRKVAIFLGKCPPALTMNALRNLQGFLAVWVEDRDHKVLGEDEALFETPVALWHQLLQTLTASLAKDSVALKDFEPLLAAGFMCHRRAIVNETIVFWNDTFGNTEALEYPERIQGILHALSAHVELALPTFPSQEVGSDSMSLPAFNDSNMGVDELLPSAKAPKSSAHVSTQASKIFGSDKPAVGRSSRKGGSTAIAKPGNKTRLRHDDSQIDFAPVDSSSPVRSTDDSRLLTDRQRDVKARQSENAQMFPDLSSSPIGKPTVDPKRLSRKLDFEEPSSTAVRDYAATTSLDLPEANGSLSDYMGSSPTPRSSDKSHPILDGGDGGEDEGDEQQDPPSSPPRGSESEDEASVEQASRDSSGEDTPKAAPNKVLNSDLPSDTTLPAEQLQLEAEIAAAISGNEHSLPRPAKAVVDKFADTTKLLTALENIIDKEIVDATTEIDQTDDDADQLAIHDGDSTVSDSFVGQADNSPKTATPARRSSQTGARESRKRKRSSTTPQSSEKKRKESSSSPFRFFPGFLWGTVKDEPETEDEIIVASSQPTSSPRKILETAVGQNDHVEVEDAESTPRAPEVDESQSSQSQGPKRGRGRPSKPEPFVAVPATSSTNSGSKQLKRKASVLSEKGDASGNSSFVADTPAVSKGQSKRSRRREAAKIKKGMATAALDEPGSVNEVGGSIQTGQLQPTTPMTSNSVRPSVTPKSILSRLRDVLSDCKNAFLGTQDLRQVDEALFTIGREAHEAARRAEG